MLCPKCKVEYREGFGQCSDCHIDLVNTLPQVNEPLNWLCPKCETKYPDSCNVCSSCHVDLEAGVCPKCKAEYQQGVRQCSDCYVDLMNTVPGEPATESEDEVPMEGELVQVATSNDFYRAQTTKSILEGQGIRCCLQDENALGILPQLTHVFGGIKVFVRKDDVEEAKKIISGIKWDSSGGQRALGG